MTFYLNFPSEGELVLFRNRIFEVYPSVTVEIYTVRQGGRAVAKVVASPPLVSYVRKIALSEYGAF